MILFKRAAGFVRENIVLLLTIWCAALTLIAFLVTVHADVFEQLDSPFLEIYSEISKSIYGPQEENISDYLESGGEAFAAGESILRSPEAEDPPPLYIFVLDVSGSVKGREIVKEEVDQYVDRIQLENAQRDALYCLGQPLEAEQWHSLALASAELCRLVGSIRIPAKVSLWIFGNEPLQVVPRSDGEHGERFLELERAENGADPRKPIFDWVRGAGDAEEGKSMESKTDFEALLSRLRETYETAFATPNQEVHLVIVSDFVHDIGSSDSERLVAEQDRWESRYRVSRQIIAEHVREIARPGNMLHLLVVKGSSLSYHNILPVLEEQGLDWADVRETRVGEGGGVSAFDFLRAYKHVGKPLVFHYTGNGQKRLRAHLKFDKEFYENRQVRIDLAADNIEDLPPLKITIGAARERPRTAEHYPGSIWPGRGGYGRVMLRSGEDGDRIWLEPAMVLEPHHANRYRVLMAWQGSGGETSSRDTYTIPIRFHKSLPVMSARILRVALWSFVAFTSALLLCGLCFVVSRTGWVWEQMKNKKDVPGKIWRRLWQQ